MNSKKIILITLFFALIAGFSSCKKYLDQAPEANYKEKDVFGDFNSFQGFVEQMYNLIVDPHKCGAWNRYLFADETLNAYPYPFDLGNYWSSETYFTGGGTANPASLSPRDRRVWEWTWPGIRIANLALEKLEEPGLFEGTQEEKNLLKGQALFFRGWFYFEICRYWGGMPYVTRVLNPTESLVTSEFDRLSFQETAKLMAKDFRAAADLLPEHWDKTTAGQITVGNNDDRINKFHALGYLGRSLLYAASPMINEEATGSNTYNAELSNQSADALAELISLANSTGIYKLQPWATWTDIFWRWNNQKTGGTEVIMNPTIYDRGRIRWSTLGGTVPSSLNMNSGGNAEVPAHSFTKNYAMANGLPISDPASGYNPNDPWTGREPRFYKDIVKDGDQIQQSSTTDKFAELFNGGKLRTTYPASSTGYYYKRYTPIGPEWTTSAANGLSMYIPYLRLADIYLMYAEAVMYSPGGSPQSKAGSLDLTAAGAVNAIRNRAQLPNLLPKYTADNSIFFEELVRERAVELAFEGARFCDLRRWNRNADPRYLEKTAIDFDRGPNGKPINISERLVIKRVAEKKHNWLPIPVSYTKQFEGFPQNPGW